MQSLTFCQMQDLALSMGFPFGGINQSRYDQLVAVLAVQDEQYRGLRPTLDEEFCGEVVAQSVGIGWVVMDGWAAPMVVTCGYSEHGCHVLLNGTHWELGEDQPFPDALWESILLTHWVLP